MGSEFISVIVLAAGASSRFGSPKQLAELDGCSLLELAYGRYKALDLVSRVNGVGLRSILVLGANENEIRQRVKSDCWSKVVVCQNWEAGMRASIQSGFEAAVADAQEQNANLQGALLCLVDQPMIQTQSLERLILLGMQEQRITCVAYDNSPGPPAYFPKNEMEKFCLWNSELGTRRLDNGGAKRFIVSRPYQILDIEDQELVDIDTPEALARVRESFKRKKHE